MRPDDHKKKKSAQYQKKQQKSQGKSENGKKDKPGKPYEQRLNRKEEGKQQKVETKKASAAEAGSSDFVCITVENCLGKSDKLPLIHVGGCFNKKLRMNPPKSYLASGAEDPVSVDNIQVFLDSKSVFSFHFLQVNINGQVYLLRYCH
jgi:hypothetical protein